MDDWVEIGVFAPGEGDALGEPLYLERHRIRRGEQTIASPYCGSQPAPGINPYRKLNDRQRDDNIVGVKPLG